MKVQPVDGISIYGIRTNRLKTIQQIKNLYNLIFTNNKENKNMGCKGKKKGK